MSAERKFLVRLLAEHSMDIGEGYYCEQYANESDKDYYKREARHFLNESNVYTEHKKRKEAKAE